jgi:hypothetical protein
METLLADCEYNADPTKDDIRLSRETWVSFRRQFGFVSATDIFTVENPKLLKSGRYSVGISFLPADSFLSHPLFPAFAARFPLDGGYDRLNACPWATDGCRSVCLNTAGRGGMDSVQVGRFIRTAFAITFPQAFANLVAHEIRKAIARKGAIAFRPNILSDIRWERVWPQMFTAYGNDVVFYDYTKAPLKARNVPTNYDLTSSAHERMSTTKILDLLANGRRVAVVFSTRKGEALPKAFHGTEVIDGDVSDERFLDGPVVVGLRAKGDAKGTEANGFVRDADLYVCDCSYCDCEA